MRIGLIGFGVVGKGLYDLAAERTDMQVVRVCCLEDVQLENTEVTKNFQDILQDETIDTVVEAMGGLHPAYEFVRASILAGKNIVTPNKALVANFYDELLPLQPNRVCFSAAQPLWVAVSAGSASWSVPAVLRLLKKSAAL